MMYTEKQIDKMFMSLPKDMQKTLTSDETLEYLKQIEKKYNLQQKQTIELSIEIGMLMLGASSPQHFIYNIQKEMEITEDTAKAIASEVNEKIFQPVKESLKTIHSLNKKEETHKIHILPTTPMIKKEETKTVVSDPYREAV
ncbi:MAG: hypothetical protein NTZ13_01230 [Candidatus Parcubacteria bacterium]|nr:hypothetical protein [Candidatus Parcubacteria bacterium]